MKFVLLALVLVVLLEGSGCAQDGDNILDFINALIKVNLNNINTAIQAHVPESFGACEGDNNPPLPCACNSNPPCGYLYYIHKPWLYMAYARWISGLKTGSLTTVFFNASSSSEITVDIQGLFASLPLSLWIGECFTFDQCSILWDNTDACCGTQKHFEVNVAVDCQNTYPYLQNIRLTNVLLDKFEITEKIIGIPINLEDITGTISEVVSTLLINYLTVETFPYNGTSVTVLEWANAQIQSFTSGNFTCP
eukprot:TRINITY_DN3503_c0_g1_i1.p1 TRINITY_DN3503_c0_g1~~TRINITY_DN3503_c0_g1_i1.p1  ORF type:complete len:251 (+),score=40.34 TRINITY_DN3503_c0_g1_i1:24-776(+)